MKVAVILNLILTNREELVETLMAGGNLVERDCEVIDFAILGKGMNSRIRIMDIRKANCNKLVARVCWGNNGKDKGMQECR